MPNIISEATALRLLKHAGADLITHPTGEFWAIFGYAFVTVSADTEVEQRSPVLTARTVDVEDLPKNVILTRLGKLFRIIRQEPDGEGETRLILSKA